MIKKESNTINIDHLYGMGLPALRSYIEAMENNLSLLEERNFNVRSNAIDALEFQIIDQNEELLQKEYHPEKLVSLQLRAEKLKSRLEEIDINLFERLRTEIREGKHRGEDFNNLINEYCDLDQVSDSHAGEPYYDNLDIFINGLISLAQIPRSTNDLEPGMVYYQKTPARIIFELVKKLHFTTEDVFFDLGSGLGQPCILVNLLAGIESHGVEFDPAFCRYANECARRLGLSKVNFINADARVASYSNGTIFFMFTSFRDEMLNAVLEILKNESLRRKIRIITYGPCTAEITSLKWLKSISGNNSDYDLSVFTSF